MRLPLILFLLATLVPIYFGKTRTAPFWLAVQAVALAWNSLTHHDGEHNAHNLAALIEFVVLRAIIAPLMLRRALRHHPRADAPLIPSNLFTWGIGVTLTVLAFDFSGGAISNVQALALGVVGSTVAIALLILTTTQEPPAQLVALLYIENAIAVFESLLPHGWPVPVHVGLSLAYIGMIGIGCWLIATTGRTAPLHVPPYAPPHAPDKTAPLTLPHD